jgi:hypothetical protein
MAMRCVFGMVRLCCADSTLLGSHRFALVRLGGDWLECAGFVVGQRIRMQVRKGRIVIEPAT